MKYLLLSFCILLQFSALAQAKGCGSPAYFKEIPFLMNKQMPDVLIGMGSTSLHYKSCFLGNTDNPGWVFVEFVANNEQVVFVFIDGRSKIAMLSGQPCYLVSEAEYLSKGWKWNSTQNTFINNDNTLEAAFDTSGDGGRMHFKVIQ